MSSIHKLGVILWKNFLFRRRHFIITTLELVLPTLLSLLLVFVRRSGGNIFKITYHDNFTHFHPMPIFPLDTYLTSKTNRSTLIIFCPVTNGTKYLTKSLQDVAEDSFRKQNVILRGVEDREALNKLVMKANMDDNEEIFLAVEFVGVDTREDKLPDKLHYRIRFEVGEWWNTDFLTSPFKLPGPPRESVYISSPFATIQHVIAMRFIEKVSNKSNLLGSSRIAAQAFPYPPYYEDAGYSVIMEILLPLFVTLSYVFISPTLIKRIVREKEEGVKELLKLMGVPGWIQWIGWFVSSLIMMIISAIFIVALLCHKSHQSIAVLNQTAPELLFLIFVMYIASAICFCFFMTTFFSKPTLATAVGVLVWIVSFCVPYFSLYMRFSRLNFSAKMATCLLPNMAMAWAVRIIAGLEGRNVGLQWSNILEPSYIGDNFCIGYVILMIIIDIILYGILTWYMDHVFPGVYGVPKPWYFIFLKSYWIEKKSAINKPNSEPDESRGANFETEPVGLSPIVVIQNLSKSYGWGEESKLAVDNVNLKMFEGQIIALLGHNGAGKTTTMSILSGMFPPSSGTAIINGFDIQTETDKARRDIGLCPQHNMLFDLLTVRETLTLFGKIKNFSGKQLEEEVKSLMEKLQLYEKRDVFADNLSGGMKRKLSLGISLIGGSKVVMLDEPTSGMDPEARRAIWDLLQEFRQDRCIILTTHFMEEADFLGDRIAIMAEGKIKCCGTPLFLKKRYGAGYHFNITKADNCNVSEITNIICRHVSSSYLDTNTSSELSFVLPSEETWCFRLLFEELEGRLDDLGIDNFGLSVTTMEEVFLKVGEEANCIQEENIPQDNNELILDMQNGPRFVHKETGFFTLGFLRFLGLLLKRFYYAKRRWVLLIAQVVVPTVVVLVFLWLNNNILYDVEEEIPLIMDLSDYGNSISFYRCNTNRNDVMDLVAKYVSSFPASATVKNISKPVSYLEDLGKNDFRSYSELHVLGAGFQVFKGIEPFILTVWYNRFYLHSLPLSLNLLHNAMVKHYTQSDRYSLVIENAPLPNYELEQQGYRMFLAMVKPVIIGVFMPIGLSFLSSSFVIFAIHERATRSKHLQLMTGVSSSLFWITSFVWDFLTHIISSVIMVIIFLTVDYSETFTSENSGWVFLILVLYGWCAIPFSYLISFLFRVPATGFTCLTVINLIAGIMLSLWLFIVQLNEGEEIFWQWFAFLVPNYTITVSFMKLVRISIMNSACSAIGSKVLEVICDLPTDKIPEDAKLCCSQICKDRCFESTPYIQWELPGLGKEIMMLLLDGLLYFSLILFVESSIVYKFLSKIWARMFGKSQIETVGSNVLDEDVNSEKEFVKNLISDGIPSEGENILVVHDLQKMFKNVTAVDHLSFSVKNAECFGLLGINGAGKTTTFKMLTGDAIPSGGQAYIKGISVIDSRTNFLSKVGYCPQFDALLDYLTGREMLSVFSFLWGINRAEIGAIVDQHIEKFDLSQHADKITLAYSGGNKRKLSAALAFIGKPPVVLLDEPTTGVDPKARRKIWTIISDANIEGTSIVLTSHSMEECEILCSRIAIMVNGQFQCLGGTQYLKNKFSQGFAILAKLKRIEDDERQEEIQKELQQFIMSQLPQASLKDIHQGLVHYQVKDVDVKWTKLFGVMEEAKERFNLEDYSVSQATLEQVFLSFARKQRDSSILSEH